MARKFENYSVWQSHVCFFNKEKSESKKLWPSRMRSIPCMHRRRSNNNKRIRKRIMVDLKLKKNKQYLNLGYVKLG